MLYFQFGLYQDITVGLQNCKVLVVCVSDEVSGSKHMYEYNRLKCGRSWFRTTIRSNQRL
jgi:hypothetical protein